MKTLHSLSCLLGAFILLAIGLFIMPIASSFAAVPQLINYQGKLTKASGAPVDTTISMIFTIYADSNGITAKWSETQTSVKVEKGVFNVLLGSANVIPDSVFDGSIRYLGVKVGGDPEITPRKPIVSVAYAYRAATGGGGGWVDDGTVVRLENSTDYVGIGTTNPEYKLDVQGSGFGFRVKNGDNYFAYDGAADVSLRYLARGSGGRAIVHEGGNVLTLNYGGDFSGGTKLGANSFFAATIGNSYINTGNVGIGTTNPAERLDVAGTTQTTGFKMPTGASNGYVLTSNASGVGTWQAAAGGDNDWVFPQSAGGTNSRPYLYTYGNWGIARFGNVLWGTNDSTHVNLGVACTTGTSGQNHKYCTVGGGGSNTASGGSSTVGGGQGNTASGYATVGGGGSNTAGGGSSTVGGGEGNTASGGGSTVGGGGSNAASWQYATVGGGLYNSASGLCATVGGGYADTASGAYSFATGFRVRIASAANYTFAFGSDFTTSASHAVIFYDTDFPIKVGIQITAPTEALDVNGTARLRNMGSSTGTDVVVDANGKLWKKSSSIRYKQNIRKLDSAPEQLLQLQPRRFEWKTTEEEDIGLIAEEVEKVIPDLVIYDKEGRPDAVKYDKITIYLLEVVKTQQEQIDDLKAKLEELSSTK